MAVCRVTLGEDAVVNPDHDAVTHHLIMEAAVSAVLRERVQ